MLASFATSLDTHATALLNGINSNPVSGTTIQLGTVSYHTAHATRPTPLWRSYISVHIHERYDSQRRRNGRESTFPVTP
jgi:hypothetical protein